MILYGGSCCIGGSHYRYLFSSLGTNTGNSPPVEWRQGFLVKSRESGQWDIFYSFCFYIVHRKKIEWYMKEALSKSTHTLNIFKRKQTGGASSCHLRNTLQIKIVFAAITFLELPWLMYTTFYQGLDSLSLVLCRLAQQERRGVNKFSLPTYFQQLRLWKQLNNDSQFL